MSTRGWVLITALVYVGLVVWLLLTLDPTTTCSANQPC